MSYRSLVLSIIASFAHRRIRRSHATIIGVTGSVGKTTAKEAAKKILTTTFATMANEKSFNSEFGVPLTILEEASGGTSPMRWAGILVRSFFTQFKKLAAEKLILEMGVDRPDDMIDLLRVVRPTIGVALAIAPVHLAVGQFDSIEAIAAEKKKLIASLPMDGIAILNADDALVKTFETNARRLTFGIIETADITATDIRHTDAGLTATIHRGDEETTLIAPIIGTHNLYPLLAAIAIGIASGIPLEKCAAALADFRLPAGRGNLIDGVNGSFLIDSSYNANVASMKAMIDTIHTLPASGRRIAVLGQMNELGTLSHELHESLGKYASEHVDEIIGVYGDATAIVDAAAARGTPAQFFATADETADYLITHLASGDVVLVKGSQNNVRLERLVKRLMADPSQADALLCRQDADWQTA